MDPARQAHVEKFRQIWIFPEIYSQQSQDGRRSKSKSFKVTFVTFKILFLLQTLYTYPDNFRAQKVLIAAEYSGAKVKLASNFVFGETNTTKEFLAKFPNGKVRFQYIHFAMSRL